MKPCIFLKPAWDKFSNRDRKNRPNRHESTGPTATEGGKGREGRPLAVVSSCTGRSMSCDLNLTVRFRRSFDEFLNEVENAYGRWMARPTAQMLVKKLQNKLKEWHGEMVFHKLSDNDPITVVADLDYRRSNGTWLVHDIELRLWRIEPKEQ